MDLATAQYIAEDIMGQLRPFVIRASIAGSIRRQQPYPNDIEIVCIPKSTPIEDMFQQVTGEERDHGFVKLVSSWEKIKGEATGKYTQRIFKNQKVDIFIVTKENFGNQLIVRTGNAEFSHMLMKIINKRGLEHRDGFLYRDDKIIPVYEEEQLFEILNIPFIEPADRDEESFKRVRA